MLISIFYHLIGGFPVMYIYIGNFTDKIRAGVVPALILSFDSSEAADGEYTNPVRIIAIPPDGSTVRQRSINKIIQYIKELMLINDSLYAPGPIRIIDEN